MGVFSHKLAAIAEYTSGGEWYRGNIGVLWDLPIHKHRPIEMFAAVCLCGQAWGWTPDLDQAKTVRKAMEKLGCPKCKRKKK